MVPPGGSKSSTPPCHRFLFALLSSIIITLYTFSFEKICHPSSACSSTATRYVFAPAGGKGGCCECLKRPTAQFVGQTDRSKPTGCQPAPKTSFLFFNFVLFFWPQKIWNVLVVSKLPPASSSHAFTSRSFLVLEKRPPARCPCSACKHGTCKPNSCLRLLCSTHTIFFVILEEQQQHVFLLTKHLLACCHFIRGALYVGLSTPRRQLYTIFNTAGSGQGTQSGGHAPALSSNKLYASTTHPLFIRRAFFFFCVTWKKNREREREGRACTPSALQNLSLLSIQPPV